MAKESGRASKKLLVTGPTAGSSLGDPVRPVERETQNKTNINPIRNAILGLVVGDGLGVPVEFKSREEMKNILIANDVGLRNCFSSLPKIQTLTGQIALYVILFTLKK